MSQALPYADLQFEMLTLEEILAIPIDVDKGCFVECDFEFPKHLHNKLKQFPPCPENIVPKKEWLIEFQLNLMEQYKIKPCKKLIPHLYKHEKYCLHYRNLKFIHELGVKNVKIRCVFIFLKNRG